MTWICVLAGALTGYVAVSCFPTLFAFLQPYRKLLGGRWELRGHWCRYPHNEDEVDYRVRKFGVAEDVEDW